MTEKRFAFVIDNGENTFYDLSKNGEIMNMIDTEDMLNQLNKENKKLHSRNKRLEERIQRERTSFIKTHERWSKEAENKIKKLSEENEKLNDECEFLEIDNESLEHGAIMYAELCHKSLKENEQLQHDATILIQANQDYRKEIEQLKGSLYAEKTNTAEVINDYSKQFKRHSKEFSFMIDLAEDLGVDVNKLEAKDD